MPWDDDLQPASWRGIPFVVTSDPTWAGRQIAVHGYPYRDAQPVWPEDTGRAPRSSPSPAISVIALCRAARGYTPNSFDDAQGVLQDVCDALDQEITAAGDAAADASYDALRALRQAGVADLTARAASLAPLVTRSFADTLPAFVAASDGVSAGPRSSRLVMDHRGAGINSNAQSGGAPPMNVRERPAIR